MSCTDRELWCGCKSLFRGVAAADNDSNHFFGNNKVAQHLAHSVKKKHCRKRWTPPMRPEMMTAETKLEVNAALFCPQKQTVSLVPALRALWIAKTLIWKCRFENGKPFPMLHRVKTGLFFSFDCRDGLVENLMKCDLKFWLTVRRVFKFGKM